MTTTTTRAARTLRSLPEHDAAAVLDAAHGATRSGSAETLAPGLTATTVEVDGIAYRVLLSIADHTTTIISVSLAEPP